LDIAFATTASLVHAQSLRSRSKTSPPVVCMSFVEGFNKVFSDPALGDKVRYREEKERFVWSAVVGYLRVTVTPLSVRSFANMWRYFSSIVPVPTRCFFDSLKPFDFSTVPLEANMPAGIRLRLVLLIVGTRYFSFVKKRDLTPSPIGCPLRRCVSVQC
jgi:hypothetical protein